MLQKVTRWRSFSAFSTVENRLASGTCFPFQLSFTGRGFELTKSVYAHFRKWSRNGEWKKVWGMILSRHRCFLDMSSVDLDGSHTTTLRGGECCGYQGRKKRTTTNAIYVTDRQGIPLAMSTPVSGSHNDLHNISQVLQDLFAGINWLVRIGTLSQCRCRL